MEKRRPNKTIILSFDVEQDAPPYLRTYNGIKFGLPRILDVLREKGVRATFFTTGDVAERFPDAVESIVGDGHELGSHGYDHKRFDKMNAKDARENVRKSLEILSTFYSIHSFRAPNLKMPLEYYKILAESGIDYDSSQATYKGWKRGVTKINGVLVVPATATSIFFRLPSAFLRHIAKSAADPVVLFSHPWEYVPTRVWRPDLSINTGEYAANALKKFIEWAKREGYRFRTLEEWGKIYVENSTFTPQ